MNYDDAMQSAERVGTERRNKRRNAYRGFVWITGAVVMTGLLIWLPEGPLQTYADHKGKPSIETARKSSVSAVPLASSPMASWSKLTVEAGETSQRIALPLDMHHLTMAGKKYRLFTVYADGRECNTFGKETCPDGPVTEYYVLNEDSKADTFLYAFVPK